MDKTLLSDKTGLGGMVIYHTVSRLIFFMFLAKSQSPHLITVCIFFGDIQGSWQNVKKILVKPARGWNRLINI